MKNINNLIDAHQYLLYAERRLKKYLENEINSDVSESVQIVEQLRNEIKSLLEE